MPLLRGGASRAGLDLRAGIGWLVAGSCLLAMAGPLWPTARHGGSFTTGVPDRALSQRPQARDNGHDSSSTGEHEDDEITETDADESPSVPHRSSNATMEASGEDSFARLIHPDKLQPFWLLPITGGMKSMVMFIAMGFGMKFKEEPPRSGILGNIVFCAKKAVSVLGSFVLIAMALICYRRDARLYLETDHSSTGVCALKLVVIWVTSPNFVSSLAIWGSLMIQSPAVLLQVRPNYRACPGLGGVPVLPCVVAWLPPAKHVYAILLFPYFAPLKIINAAMSGALCWWITCITSCSALKFILFAICACECSIFCVILTLGLWPRGREMTAYWFDKTWPFLYFTILQTWASLIVPAAISLLYGACLGAEFTETVKGIALAVAGPEKNGVEAIQSALDVDEEKVNDAVCNMCFQTAGRVHVEADDRAKLTIINKEIVKHDFMESDEKLKGSYKELITHIKTGKVTGDIDKLRIECEAAGMQFNNTMERVMGKDVKICEDQDHDGGMVMVEAEGIADPLALPPNCVTDIGRGLEDTKVVIVMKTLMFESVVIITQITFLFTARVLLGNDADSYVMALKRTFTERTLASYMSGVESLAQSRYSAVEYFLCTL